MNKFCLKFIRYTCDIFLLIFTISFFSFQSGEDVLFDCHVETDPKWKAGELKVNWLKDQQKLNLTRLLEDQSIDNLEENQRLVVTDHCKLSSIEVKVQDQSPLIGSSQAEITFMRSGFIEIIANGVCLFVFMDAFFRRKLGIPNEI